MEQNEHLVERKPSWLQSATSPGWVGWVGVPIGIIGVPSPPVSSRNINKEMPS
jgi:hypothetical protein